MNKNILPMVLIIIDLVQSIVCVFHKDFVRALYWLSAGVLTATTMFMR
jgi:hypothetical protein